MSLLETTRAHVRSRLSRLVRVDVRLACHRSFSDTDISVSFATNVFACPRASAKISNEHVRRNARFVAGAMIPSYARAAKIKHEKRVSICVN
jgi:hypothetical protein